MKTSISLALFALMSGCASINHSDKGKSMVDIENTGWYLFNVLPIATGDTDHPNENTCLWFENSVNLENNAKMLDRIAKRNNAARVDDVVSYTTEEHVFFVLLKRKCFHTSARLEK